jgi:endonuclease YncB( thermonuclease family)
MNRRRSCARCIATLIALTALVAACSKPTPAIPKPPYPYGIPTADDPDVTELEVLRAYDGSLLEVRLPGKTSSFDLNLGHVMAPMPAQPWGERATDALQRLTAGQRALVWGLDLESYRELSVAAGRALGVGTVYVNGVDVAWEMVGSGNAWVAPNSGDAELKALEIWARQTKTGLWSLPEAERIAPWDFAKIPHGRMLKPPPPRLPPRPWP